MGGGGGRGQSPVSPQAGVKAERPGFGKLGRRCKGSPDTESILVANLRGAPTPLQAWLGAPCLRAGVEVAASGVGRIDQMYLLAGKVKSGLGVLASGGFGGIWVFCQHEPQYCFRIFTANLPHSGKLHESSGVRSRDSQLLSRPA